MPRQNRVDPCGNIVAHPARGLLMGNRGCLHDDTGRIIRDSDRVAWITCLPCWPGVRRTLMAPGCYTELFFLDEATALAAGHRPCGSCRPNALAAFKRAWAETNRLPNLPRVAEIDSALKAARVIDGGAVDAVPDGGMIVSDGIPMLRWTGQWLAWSFDGYTTTQHKPKAGKVLTPEPVIRVLRKGYIPIVHGSASAV